MIALSATSPHLRYSLLLLLLWGYAASLMAGGEPAVRPVVEVDIIKFQFTPQQITIKAGDTVRWTNREKRQYHSVWFEQQGDPEPDYFFPGESYQRTFEQAGVFPYRCGPHPKMTGTVTVE